MKTMRLHSIALVSGLLLVAATRDAGAVTMDIHHGVVSGRVVQAMSNGQVVGAAGLQVKLIPPTSEKRPNMISVTNSRGEYEFPRQNPGLYLFEVYRGPVLLYRRVLNTGSDSTFTVTLKRRT